MKKIIAILFASGSLFITSCGGGNSNTETDSKKMAKEENEKKFDDTSMEDDAAFVAKIADAGMMEVETGKLALTNAASPKVKEFGQMMIDDHTKANAELEATAKAKNITIPATLSDAKQKKYAELAAKKGADFDKEYMSAMVDGHQDVIDAFKKEADKGKDADIKKWAADKLPTLQHHLEVAKQTKDGLK